MKKLIINKNDDPSIVVEKILESNEKDIVLVIPKSSKISNSVANFHLIKREAEADSKNLLIESVDDEALALAKAAKLPGINPFLSMHKKSMSDIIAQEPTVAKQIVLEKDDVAEVDFTAKDKLNKPKLFLPKIGHMKGLIAAVAIIIPVFTIAAITTAPRVSVSLNVEEYPWQFEEKVSVISGVEKNDLTANTIAGEVFTEKKNLTLEFNTSGEKKVEKKATGMIKIYNAFSSTSQPLVATTRLLTPDGKLFRLVDNITVPGANIVDGEIAPSSIDAKVIADKPGAEYNIGPVERFSIPGFQGTSKYKAFYGASLSNMAGGFIGVISFPTDEDAKKAKAKVEKQLAENLKAFSSNSIPENFIVLSDASKITINKIEIVEDINKEGKFSVYGEGQLKTIAFPKISFLELLQKKASDQIGFSVSLEENKLLFNNISTNIDSNSIFFNVDWNGVATRLIDDETIKQAIKGKNSADLKNYITSLDGVASAKISFWPFWVKKSPDNTSKINIEIVK
ncbi:MAG: hypothetical protein COV57_02225 [Candidatus Liptonbacteria bacterium CG11_big_fil_rev_8_21_14_0_20_35_14]|uniref:Baseplate protein J-like domain-containing protein n=1 Tax=Candidatus Liptonbacteria bacterium CG11_big_fil_rev_8_21_14_0_20_35_14 TaxID=1974634 RepID=A0A2H0N7F2_9BACT|nr:MAG: hypothetical protein COV57_02225 [Candidatus Liptonbacteria bacterium CG11_big_fil_rev_8_21_14_0_20_35_14]